MTQYTVKFVLSEEEEVVASFIEAPSVLLAAVYAAEILVLDGKELAPVQSIEVYELTKVL